VHSYEIFQGIAARYKVKGIEMFYDEKTWQDFVCFMFIDGCDEREFDLKIKSFDLVFKIKEKHN